MPNKLTKDRRFVNYQLLSFLWSIGQHPTGEQIRQAAESQLQRAEDHMLDRQGYVSLQYQDFCGIFKAVILVSHHSLFLLSGPFFIRHEGSQMRAGVASKAETIFQ